jgi:hypothetical protein
MCHLVTIGVPAKSPEERLAAFKAVDVYPDETENPSVLAMIGPSKRAYALLRGGCSCDLVAAPEMPDQTDKLAAKYKRKGWSDAKTTRALKAHQDSLEKDVERTRQRSIAPVIAKLVKDLGTVDIVTHWYTGQFATEVFTVSARRELRVGDGPLHLRLVPEEHLVLQR